MNQAIQNWFIRYHYDKGFQDSNLEITLFKRCVVLGKLLSLEELT